MAGECPMFVLETMSASVTFDCATPDASPSALVWVWTDVQGWWDAPGLVRDTLNGLGVPVVSVPTAARWSAREITVKATAVCGGTNGLLDALDTLTALCDMLRVPGTFTSTEAVPKMVSVRLSDRPRYTIRGEARFLDVEIPMVAHDPLRTVVAGGARVL